MTKQEFESYTRGIAYDMIRFKRKEINGDELFKAMKVKIGRETFKAAQELMDEEDNY
jgi:hypothetical protein